MNPILKSAIAEIRGKVEAYIKGYFPDAIFFTVSRESDWSEWYNYTPQVYDINFEQLNPEEEENADGSWTIPQWDDDFGEHCSSDLDDWLNNELSNSGEYVFVIGGEGHIPDPRPKSAPPPACPDDQILLRYGVYCKTFSVGTPLSELNDYILEHWVLEGQKENLHISPYQGNVALDVDFAVPASTAVEFHRRMTEKSGQAQAN